MTTKLRLPISYFAHNVLNSMDLDVDLVVEPWDGEEKYFKSPDADPFVVKCVKTREYGTPSELGFPVVTVKWGDFTGVAARRDEPHLIHPDFTDNDPLYDELKNEAVESIRQQAKEAQERGELFVDLDFDLW